MTDERKKLVKILTDEKGTDDKKALDSDQVPQSCSGCAAAAVDSVLRCADNCLVASIE